METGKKKKCSTYLAQVIRQIEEDQERENPTCKCLEEQKNKRRPKCKCKPDPMEDPLYRYRQPKLIDFDKILDPEPNFPEGNLVILLKLLRKKPIPGVLHVEYDWNKL